MLRVAVLFRCCKLATLRTPTIMTQVLTTLQRRRHLGAALMSCALVFGAYLLWTSTSGHVVGYRLNDFRQSQVDWRLSRLTRYEASHNVERLSRRKLVNDQFHDLDKQASNQALPMIDNLDSGTFNRMYVSDNSVQVNNFTFSGSVERVRPITQQHKEQQSVTGQDHLGRTPPTTADDSKKNRKQENRRKLQDQHAAEIDFLSDKYSNKHKDEPRTSIMPTNSSHSMADKTPKPLYLVVSNDEKDKKIEEVFKEPEVVIRAPEADMPRTRGSHGKVSGISSEYGPGGGKRSPLLGKLQGGPGHCRVYNTRDDVPELVDFAAGVDCVDLSTTPSVVVCPYPDTDDRHLSQPLRTHGVWEPHIVRLFQAALLADKQFGVYDIGANVGQYALLAAAMGRRVVAVEMHRPNIYRIHKAIKLGRLENKIVVVENGVSDERDTFELVVKDGDPSGVRLTTKDADRFCDEPGCPPHATTILLDDLLEVTNFKAAVMKIDIEGYEHRAFSDADELLSDVRVAYIFMEWVKMRELYGADADRTPDKRLAQKMIDTLTSRQYLPYGITNAPMRALDLRRWYAWPDDIVWVLAGSVEPTNLAKLAPDVPSSKQDRTQTESILAKDFQSWL